MKSKQHKGLKLPAMTFFRKSCTGKANKDVPSVTLEVADVKNGSSQTTKGVKQHFQDKDLSWGSQMK